MPGPQEEEEAFVERVQTIAEGIRAWTKGEGSAVVQLPGELPRRLTVDEVREAKKPREN